MVERYNFSMARNTEATANESKNESKKRKQQYSTETVSKINRRRRDLYKQLSVDEKEVLLTRRRSKKLELKKGPTALLEYTKQAAGLELHREKTLTIVEAPCVAAKGISSVVGAVVDCHKGKNISDHFSVFEHGSTSGASYDRHHAETSTVINKGILKRSSKVKYFHKLVLKGFTPCLGKCAFLYVFSLSNSGLMSLGPGLAGPIPSSSNI